MRKKNNVPHCYARTKMSVIDVCCTTQGESVSVQNTNVLQKSFQGHEGTSLQGGYFSADP